MTSGSPHHPKTHVRHAPPTPFTFILELIQSLLHKYQERASADRALLVQEVDKPPAGPEAIEADAGPSSEVITADLVVLDKKADEGELGDDACDAGEGEDLAPEVRVYVPL